MDFESIKTCILYLVHDSISFNEEANSGLSCIGVILKAEIQIIAKYV